MVLARLTILMLKARTAAFVMIMVLMDMKHGWMGIDFIQQTLAFSVIEEKQRKGYHQTILHDG